MAAVFHVDVVSAEAAIFSGEAVEMIAPGEIGELGILARHAPLMTRVRPGTLRVKGRDGKEELIYVSGGIMEVQPGSVTVLADTSVRAADLDEARAVEAKRAAEERLASNVSELERARALAELAQAAAQISAIQKLRKR
jgi:F-type H+-transporting ATPase subunit epsilon